MAGEAGNYLEDLNKIDSKDNSDLSILKKEIGELLNDAEEDNGLERLSGSLTSGLSDYLKGHNEDVKTLLKVIDNLPEQYANNQEIMNLKAFLQPLIQKDWELNDPETDILKVNLVLDSNIQGILSSKIVELNDKVSDAGLKNTLNQIYQIISNPNKQNFDQLSKFLDDNNIPNNGLTADDPKYAIAVANRLNIFLGYISNQIDIQTSIMNENDNERANENKAYNELMSYISGDLSKLNKMSKKDLVSLDAFIRRPNNQELVFDLYYKIKHDVSNLNSEGMDAKDEGKFNDILNLIESKYKNSPELHEYELGKVFEGVASSSKSLNDFLNQKIDKSDWNGKDLDNNLDVSSISDKYNFSATEFINKFNSFNKERREGNDQKISSIDVSALLNNDLLKLFSVEDGEDGKKILKFNGADFTVDKMYEIFGGQIGALAKEGTDFLNDEEMVGVIGKYKDAMFNKLISELPNLIENKINEPVEGNNLKEPSINWTGKLEGIKVGDESQKKTGKAGLYSGLTRDKLEGVDENENLGATMEKVSQQIESVKVLLGNEKLSDSAKESLTRIDSGLNSVLNSINYPTGNNVRILQEFISKNLEDGSQEKTQFDALSRNKKSGNFDGKFGKGTLKGVNLLLNKTNEYITGMRAYLDKLVLIDGIKIKTEVKIPQGGAITKDSFVDGTLPQGVDLSFEPSLDSISLDNVGDKTITVKVTNKDGEELKSYNVTLKVENKPAKDSEADTHNPEASTNVDRSPLTLGDNQYLVMENSGIIGAPSFRGATFYSTTEVYNSTVQSNESGNAQPQLAKSTEMFGGDRLCYMRYKGDIYQVKVDQGNCVCPVATKIDFDLVGKNGKFQTSEVLLSDLDTCKAYLHNKLPNEIKYCEIGWNDIRQDYVLQSHGRELTIEPMTIAGEWICKKTEMNPDYLSKSLAFLNLTNKIRSKGREYNTKDPLIKFDNRELWIRGLIDPNTGKRVKLSLPGFPGSYGLATANPQEFSDFMRYNNDKDWKDNWDKKKANRIYKKIY